jgi:hypothetical protein
MQPSTKLRTACRSIAIFLLCLIAAIGCRAQRTAQPSGPLSPSEARFAPGTTMCEIPFKVIDDNMYITIRVNDSVEVAAAFDSGFPLNGVLIIDSAIGERLGLTYISSIPLGGAGDEAAVADLATGATISLPCVSFAGQQALVIRNSRQYEKWPADAIIGGTILNACVVEIDHEKSVLRVYKQGSFRPGTAGEPLALSFSSGIPVVEAAVTAKGGGPKPVHLLVDTGADVPFSFHSDRDPDLHPPEDAPKCYIAEGIKGGVYGKWFRVGAIRIGPFTLNNCLVAYPTEGFDQAEEQLGQDGFFGLGAQSHFTVTFDYPHARLYLKPNVRFGEPFEFNMAGLVLWTLHDGSCEVSDVIEGSPGDEAGIKKGDTIVAVDGRAVSAIPFAERERSFIQAGRSLLITVQRNGGKIDIPVVLRRVM